MLRNSGLPGQDMFGGSSAKWMALAVVFWILYLLAFLFMLNPRAIFLLIFGSPLLMIPTCIAAFGLVGSVVALVIRGRILKSAGCTRASFFNTAMIVMTVVVGIGSWILG